MSRINNVFVVLSADGEPVKLFTRYSAAITYSFGMRPNGSVRTVRLIREPRELHERGETSSVAFSRDRLNTVNLVVAHGADDYHSTIMATVYQDTAEGIAERADGKPTIHTDVPLLRLNADEAQSLSHAEHQEDGPAVRVARTTDDTIEQVRQHAQLIRERVREHTPGLNAEAAAAARNLAEVIEQVQPHPRVLLRLTARLDEMSSFLQNGAEDEEDAALTRSGAESATDPLEELRAHLEGPAHLRH